MNKSKSMFVSGILVGALLAAVGFSLFLRGQKVSGGLQRQLVLKLGHGLDTSHPVHKFLKFMKERLEVLSNGTLSLPAVR